jgi:hypothetical protein
MKRDLQKFVRCLPVLFLMVSPLLVAFGCSSDATGVKDSDDGCTEVGVLMICGADTTRVDTH